MVGLISWNRYPELIKRYTQELLYIEGHQQAMQNFFHHRQRHHKMHPYSLIIGMMLVLESGELGCIHLVLGLLFFLGFFLSAPESDSILRISAVLSTVSSLGLS